MIKYVSELDAIEQPHPVPPVDHVLQVEVAVALADEALGLAKHEEVEELLAVTTSNGLE